MKVPQSWQRSHKLLSNKGQLEVIVVVFLHDKQPNPITTLEHQGLSFLPVCALYKFVSLLSKRSFDCWHIHWCLNTSLPEISGF